MESIVWIIQNIFLIFASQQQGNNEFDYKKYRLVAPFNTFNKELRAIAVYRITNTRRLT